jgi:hypothetical protein
MRMGFFDSNDEHWIVPIADERGKSLDFHKSKVHTARDKIDITRKLHFRVKRLVWCQQSNAPNKFIILEEIEWESDKRTELRMAYYTTSRTGHWWWGQFAVMIPRKDLEELLRFGREKELLSN